MEYEIHPFAKLFPRLPDDEMKNLAEDIKENGLRLPIVRWKGQITDGQNRLIACEMAGVEPIIKDREDVLENESDVAKFIVSINCARRHLTSSERAAIAVELMEVLKKETEKPKATGTEESKTPKQDKSEKPKGKTAAIKEAAEAVQTNPTYVSQAAKIKEENPEKFEQIKKGEKSIPQAKGEIEKNNGTEDSDLEQANKTVISCCKKLEKLGYKLVSTKIEKLKGM